MIRSGDHIGAVFGQRTQLWWDLAIRESFDLFRHIYRIPIARFLGWTINANYMTYPLTVYDTGIRYIFTLFPMAFITYYPAASFLGKTDEWGYQLGTYSPLVGMMFFLSMYGFWRLAAGSYQSAG